MITLALMLSLHAAPGDAQVAIVVYQGAGREPERARALTSAVAAEVTSRGFAVLAPAEAEKHQRAAAMCGEDAECLGTVGQRAGVPLVLGLGLAEAGKELIVSALLVESGAAGRRHFLTRLPAATAELGLVAAEAVRALLEGRTPRLLPRAPEPVAPGVAALTAPPLPRLRTPAVVTAVGAGALALAGLTLTVVAQQHHQGLAQVPEGQRPGADATQRGLNLAADLTVGTAIAAGVTSALLFLLDRP